MKSNLLTDLDCISLFPLVMGLPVPVVVPALPLPPLPARGPVLPTSCRSIYFPGGLPGAGGSRGQGAKKRDEEHGNWEKGNSEWMISRRNDMPAAVQATSCPQKKTSGAGSLGWVRKARVWGGERKTLGVMSAEENPLSIRWFCPFPVHPVAPLGLPFPSKPFLQK